MNGPGLGSFSSKLTAGSANGMSPLPWEAVRRPRIAQHEARPLTVLSTMRVDIFKSFSFRTPPHRDLPQWQDPDVSGIRGCVRNGENTQRQAQDLVEFSSVRD